MRGLLQRYSLGRAMADTAIAVGALVVTLLAFGCAPQLATAQQVDTVGWTHDSTASGLDTAGWVRDSTPITTWHYDSTASTKVHWVYDSTPVTQPHVTPPPVASACPNQPAGATLIVSRGYNAKDVGWGQLGAFSLVADPSAPDGDGSVGRMFYSATGKRVGSATMASWYIPTIQGAGYTGLYTCYWQKVDPTFQLGGGGAQGTKQFWFLVGTTAENRIIVGLDGKSPSGYKWGIYPMRATLALQGTGNIASTPWNGSAVSRGQWFRVEVLGQIESAKGAADGWITLYVNGKQATRYSGVEFTKGSEPLEWTGFKWNNTIGGGMVPCTSANWVPKDATGKVVASLTIGGVVYTANNGVLPTQAQHPECFYPVNSSIYIDGQTVWGYKGYR